MKTVKPLSLSVLHRVVEHGRRFHFTVTGVVFIDLADTSKPLPEVALWKLVPAELGEGAVLDDAMPKSRGEVLVTGSAHVPGAAPDIACDVRVRIGAVDKTLRVFGDRAWDAYGVASAPTPFTSMPLRYTHAFGGEGFALNPVGKGFGETPGAPRALPNVEDPRWPLRSPGDTAAPAGFGAYDFTWPQRASKLGTYDDRWLREDMPGFARDIDWTAFNVAPEDQWIDGYFQGDEGFVLENLHPERPRIEGRLPGLAVRAFVNRATPEGERFDEVPTRLDTVHFFPGAMRAALLYRGVVEVTEDDAADVLQLVAACERGGAPRTVEHYRDVLARRMDREKGALHALREQDLMPEGLALSLDALDDAPRSENLLAVRLRRRAELQLARMREALAKQNLDPDQHLPRTLPEPEPAPSIDELPDTIDRLRAEADRRRTEIERMRAEAEARARARCAEHGIDYDKATPKPGDAVGGPPRPLRASLAAAKARIDEARAQGFDTSAAEAALADPTLHARLAEAEAKQLDAYRKGAHFAPPAARHDAEASAHAREVVAARYRSGEGFAQWDLTGYDLSGMHLPGADFRDALMECASFNGANLDGADLSGAVLTRADLGGATLSGARLRGANLGGASLQGARANEPADFTDATLWGADLSDASLAGATLDGVTLFEAKLAGAELRGVSARNATFVRAGLSGLRLHEASLQGATFIECDLRGADLTGARMKGAGFVQCRGDDATFRGADLENLRVVHGSSFERADFQEARMPGATLRGTRLAAARFSKSDLDGSDFSECDLTGAQLHRASAREARFIRATLTGAVMTSAGLLGAILQKATLTDADFTDAVLFGADMARTRGRPRSLEGANLQRVRVVGGGA